MSNRSKILLVLAACLMLGAPLLVASQESAAELLRQARALFDQRKFAEAAIVARRARQADPKLRDAWRFGALALQLSQNYGEAEQEFSEALKLFPNDADMWFELARVQYLQSSLKKSEASARRALELEPDSAGGHTILGMTLEAMNDYANALEHYRRAIHLYRAEKRIHTVPFFNASQLLIKQEQFAEAADYLTEVIALNPHSDLYFVRGGAYEKAGKPAEAEKDYRQAVAIDGNAQARAALERLRAGIVPTGRKEEGGNGRKVEGVKFRDVAAQARLGFTLRNAASPRKYQIETMTGGVAVIDYDGDGWEDIYFANGAELPAMKKSSPQFWNRLYRNNRDGTFVDVTEKAGVAGEGFSMGVAVADYDNDGDADIFVAGVNRNLLFRNDGKGHFDEVTAKAGLANTKLWSVAAAWFDYDNDGDLDLFVANYCKWHLEADPYCGAQKEGWRTYCFPDKYEGLPNQLFRNNGDGTFTDVSSLSGIARHIGKGMGVAVADYDDDGLMDVFVANDTLPNFLFHNLGQGRFEEVALRAGVAVNESGRPVSAMGVDFRDYDNDGLPDLIVSALEGETFSLFRNLGKGFFADATWPSGVGVATVKRSGWSLGLFDFNNDGFKDLFATNAHVNDNIELYNEQTYRQPNSLLVNLGNGNFQDVSTSAGADFQSRRAHRGAAFADFDNDGRIDVVTTSLNEPAELWRNESTLAGKEANHWLKLKLVGVRSNRDGIGARVKVVMADGKAQFNHVTTSVGYASSSSPLIHFGLGKEKLVKLIEIRWPSGAVQRLKEVAADRLLNITEDPN